MPNDFKRFIVLLRFKVLLSKPFTSHSIMNVQINMNILLCVLIEFTIYIKKIFIISEFLALLISIYINSKLTLNVIHSLTCDFVYLPIMVKIPRIIRSGVRVFHLYVVTFVVVAVCILYRLLYWFLICMSRTIANCSFCNAAIYYYMYYEAYFRSSFADSKDIYWYVRYRELQKLSYMRYYRLCLNAEVTMLIIVH